MVALFSSSPFFMGILTLNLIVLFAWFIYYVIAHPAKSKDRLEGSLGVSNLTSIGLFALVVGILHQLIAWYSMITAIEEAADINAEIVITAIKSSMVPLIYGVSIFLVSLVLLGISKLALKRFPQSCRVS